MPPQLLALTDGPSILLDKPILLLGRHQECDIQLPSRKVSRRHCCIAQVNDYLVVRDLCSTNGIRINGIRVLGGALKPGDELTIGNYRYQVRWESIPESPPLSPRPAAGAPGRRRTDVNDDELEACEEPVPLEEPEAPAQGAEPQTAPPASPVPVAAPATPVKPPPGPADEHILPEDLELAPPPSDQFPALRDQPKPAP
jgi:predicted component of type VI protein secretion system